MKYNRAYISQELADVPEPVPLISGSCPVGKVWISDAERRRRYDDLSIDCPDSVFSRFNTMHIYESNPGVGPSPPKADHWRECRIERMANNAKQAMDAGLSKTNQLQKATAAPKTGTVGTSDDTLSTEGLRSKVRKIRKTEVEGNWNAQTWQQVVDVCRIVGADPHEIQAKTPEWIYNRIW